MFELDTKYKRGKKTFIFLYVCYGWWLTLIGAGFLYLSYAVAYGPLKQFAADFLLAHSDWFIDSGMIAKWSLMLGFSFLIIAGLRVAEVYMHFKFILDDHSFNLERGLFFTRETTIPYQQISNVHIARPYHYRLFGIAQLDIVTAADKSLSHGEGKKDSKEFLIPIIDASIAKALSKQLIIYASKSRKGEEIEEDEPEVIDATDESGDNDEIATV